MFKQRQFASSKNESLIVTVEGSNPASWTKLVMDLYPPGTSIR